MTALSVLWSSENTRRARKEFDPGTFLACKTYYTKEVTKMKLFRAAACILMVFLVVPVVGCKGSVSKVFNIVKEELKQEAVEEGVNAHALRHHNEREPPSMV